MRLVFSWLSSVLGGLRVRTRRVGGTRRRAVFGLTTVVMAGVMALFVASALGTAPAPNPLGDPSAFEAADGNMTLETNNGLDWNCLTSLAPANCGPVNNSYMHAQYADAGTSGDISWPSGSKLDAVCPVLSPGNVSNKDTFTDISSYHDAGANATAGGRIDTYLYGATIRPTANGSASENVVLQQGLTTSGAQATPCANEPTPTGQTTPIKIYPQTLGDKLIAIDYGGGATATFHLLTWIGAGQGTCAINGHQPPCWGNSVTLPAGTVEGASNTATIPNTANGIQAGDVADTDNLTGGAQTLPAGFFAEFGMNLVSSGIVQAGKCETFANTLWEARSSGSSFTSNPSDVESQGSTFSTCQPATIQVHKIDGNTNKGLAGAHFSLFAGSATTGMPLATCTSADGTGTTPLGDCDFSVVGSATSTYTVVETSPPPGYNLPAATSQPCSITFSQTAQPDACDLTFTDTPAPGSITIQKNDVNGKGLTGAVFSLYTDDGSQVTMGDSPTSPDSDDHVATGDATNLTCPTDGNGACTFQSVNAPGTYMVFETTTPPGYQTAPSEVATVGLGSTPGTGQTVTLPPFTDPYAAATINVIKQDNSTPPNALNGAVFSLYKGASATGTAIATCTTGPPPSTQAAGDCTLGSVNVTQGTQFTIGETTAPDGYATAPSQTFTVTWTNASQTITKTFADAPVPGTITVRKQDSSNAPLNGAVFGLYKTDSTITVPGGDSPINPDQDDSAVTTGAPASPVTCTTGAGSNPAGACSFTNVPLGPYTVFETATPAGYETAQSQTVTIGLGPTPGTGDSKTLTFTDPYAPATINVIKQDNSTPPNALNGAVFSLYKGASATGTAIATCTTGSPSSEPAGACSFGSVNITQGTQFTIAETTTPNGYSTAASQTITVNWTTGPQTITLTFTDAPVPGTINIQKFDDASPPNALDGATFTLYQENGGESSPDSATSADGDDTPVTGSPTTVTCTTAGGVCSLTSVPLGSYTLFETTTPAGHQTAPAQDVTVGLGPSAGVGQTVPLTFVDPRLHKEIVLVCSEGTNTLDSSTVTIDGGTAQQSLDETATLPSGVTQASLCGLGGATKSDLPDGASSTAQIAIH